MGEFAEYAPVLADNGYFPVPIHEGKKKPALDEWSAYIFKRRDLRRFPREGCGLLTRLTPALDADVMDHPCGNL